MSSSFPKITSLLRLNPSRVTYPQNLQNTVRKSISSWKKFCLLPEAAKSPFLYETTPKGDSSGYEYKRSSTQSKTDSKENFHISQNQLPRLIKVSQFSSVRPSNEAFDFLYSSTPIINYIAPIIERYTNRTQKRYNITGLTDEVLSAKPYWIIRYIHYYPSNTPYDQYLAAPHIDKNGFTIHLSESDDGLEHLCINTRTWKPISLNYDDSNNKTIILAGAQLQYRSDGQIKAHCHRVVPNLLTNNKGRYSMVCFIPLQNTPNYDKARFGNLQTQPIGFNYDITNTEFSKYFSG